MKSHEQKMQEKKEHEKELERNDLLNWLMRTWNRLKKGELVSARFALLALFAGAALGLIFYLSRGGTSKEALAWQAYDSTRGIDALTKFAENEPNTVQGRVARLQVARQKLGPDGIQLLSSIDPSARSRGIVNIEDARTSLLKLIEEFKEDMTLQAQAIEAAAQGELALAGIPKEGQPLIGGEYRGSAEAAAELYRRYAKVVGDSTAAGKRALERAESLVKHKTEVFQLGSLLNTRMTPEPPPPQAPSSLTPVIPPTPPVTPPASPVAPQPPPAPAPVPPAEPNK